MSALAPTLQAFFTSRLNQQRQVSSRTVDSYRDAFRLLLIYANTRTGIAPSRLDLADLDAELIAGFLDSHRQQVDPGDATTEPVGDEPTRPAQTTTDVEDRVIGERQVDACHRDGERFELRVTAEVMAVKTPRVQVGGGDLTDVKTRDRQCTDHRSILTDVIAP